jgi:hypothetical protein
MIGLTNDQRLICFSEVAPDMASTIGTITGLIGGDDRIVGIDFRVQDETLYGVGNAGGVYVLSTTDASAQFVNRLTIALNGSSFGVDFNPAADRLRIVSNSGQNLRHDVNTGATIMDGALNYGATTATGITGAAYTNNDRAETTATTLYNVDSNLDQITIQSPPNAGSLEPTGKLTQDAGLNVGFDIYSRLHDGVAVDNQGIATLTSSTGGTRLYRVTLSTGRATPRGSFRAENEVIDVAVPPNQF